MRDAIELSPLATEAISTLQESFDKNGGMNMTEEQLVEFCVFFACISLGNAETLVNPITMLTLVACKQVVMNTAPPEYMGMFRQMVLGKRNE